MGDDLDFRGLNVFFDVDYTLISYEGVLRPFVREIFQALVQDGHRVYIWSGVGLRHAEVQRHGLQPYVSGVYVKPLDRFRERLLRLGVEVVPDFIVDDYPDIVEEFGGVLIAPFTFAAHSDTEMLRVYAAICQLAQERSGGTFRGELEAPFQGGDGGSPTPARP